MQELERVTKALLTLTRALNEFKTQVDNRLGEIEKNMVRPMYNYEGTVTGRLVSDNTGWYPKHPGPLPSGYQVKHHADIVSAAREYMEEQMREEWNRILKVPLTPNKDGTAELDKPIS